MATFDMITNPPPHLIDLADRINNRYFTIDTADMATIHDWISYNPYIVTYAILHDDVIGFFNIMPITMECAALFDQQAIKEEDLTRDHIVHPDAFQHAQYAYLAAIAIKDRSSYQSRQCAAALISTIADHLLYGYDGSKLKRVYANPTTFDGNHLVRKLGLKPIVSFKKPLKGNDIYALDITPETRKDLEKFSWRYARFVGSNPWRASAPE